MNNIIYPLPNNPHQQILEQLLLINESLKRIEKKLDNKIIKKEKNYLEKDDNYYVI